MRLTNRGAFCTFALALVAAALLVGCGESAPSAPAAAVVTQPEGGQVLLAFSAEAAQGVGKIATANDALTASAKINSQGGVIEIVAPAEAEAAHRLAVTFTVPPLALRSATIISMAVYGQTLSELLVGFEPGGLVFLTDASLGLSVGAARVDVPVADIIVLHIHDDGTVETVGFQAGWTNDSLYQIQVAVPGFSVYSLGGGR
ncbi:MAG: hypothetical protein ABIL09_10540 [Gemmatimonadota bacterium]